MLDDALHRVALDVLDNGHLGLVTILDGEQGVGVTQSQSGLLHRQLHEGRILATRVNGGRDEVRDAHAAVRAAPSRVMVVAIINISLIHRSYVSAHRRAA